MEGDHTGRLEQQPADSPAGFRAREAAALRRVTAQGPQVIAVGGGAPAHGDNMDFMLHAGKVICLTATVDELVARVGSAETRPMLAGKDVRAEAERLLEQRQPHYARAHVTVDTTGLVPSAVVKAIVEAIEK